MTRSPPPTKLATFLLLAVLVAPLAAQTTVTSSGRDGETACMGQTEVNAANLPITTLTSNFGLYSAPAVTWGQYTGRLGDTTPPANATVYHAVYNASTKASVFKSAANLVNSENNYSGESQALPGLTAKTNYYVEVYAAASGSIPKQVFARRCFMTGGTYTISAEAIASGPTEGSTGCFTISPLTQQDVRNCWCGRKTTRPLFSSTQDNTNFLNRWGCR